MIERLENTAEQGDDRGRSVSDRLNLDTPLRTQALPDEIVDRIDSYGQEFQPITQFIDPTQALEQLTISVDEILSLPINDRKELLSFIGKISAALPVAVPAALESWKKRLAYETALLQAGGPERDRILTKVLKTAALMIEREKDTNCSGSKKRFIRHFENLALSLNQQEHEEEALLVVNPWRLKHDSWLFSQLSSEDIKKWQISQVGIDFLPDGIQTQVDFGKSQQSMSLPSLNLLLANGLAVHPEMDCYFGRPRHVSDLIETGNHYFFKPSKFSPAFEVKVVGTNAAELEKQYGPGAHRFYPSRLEAIIEYQGEHQGETDQLAFSQFRDLDPIVA